MTLRLRDFMNVCTAVSTTPTHTGKATATLTLALLALACLLLPAQRASAGCEILIEAPEEHPPTANFGKHVALEGDIALISDIGQHMNSLPEAGAVFVYERDGVDWPHIATLGASDGFFRDYFGTSVASQGDVIAVGAPNRDIGQTLDVGAIYIFRRQGASWVQESILTAPNFIVGEHLGSSIAISGNTIVTGAPAWSPLSAGHGAAHVFVYNGTTWEHQARLSPSDQTERDFFGNDVAINGDDIIIGARQHGPVLPGGHRPREWRF